jgi:hypothetical protein
LSSLDMVGRFAADEHPTGMLAHYLPFAASLPAVRNRLPQNLTYAIWLRI